MPSGPHFYCRGGKERTFHPYFTLARNEGTLELHSMPLLLKFQASLFVMLGVVLAVLLSLQGPSQKVKIFLL